MGVNRLIIPTVVEGRIKAFLPIVAEAGTNVQNHFSIFHEVDCSEKSVTSLV